MLGRQFEFLYDFIRGENPGDTLFRVDDAGALIQDELSPKQREKIELERKQEIMKQIENKIKQGKKLDFKEFQMFYGEE